MFWHGRKYGHNTLVFTLIMFFKIWDPIWQVWVINGTNGMSCVTYLESLYYALYAVVLMNYQIVWWNTHNTDVDPIIEEKALPFRYSDLYAYCRKDFSSYSKIYFILVVLCGIVVLVSQYCYLYTDVMGSNG